MKILLPALLALAFPGAVEAAPDVAAVAPPKPITSIDPKARAIFARAVALYGKTNGLSATWRVKQNAEVKLGSFDFDRAGRLRLVNNYALESLIVIDSKTKWVVDESEINDNAVRYIRQSVDADAPETDPIFVLQSSLGLVSPIGDFLGKTNSLDAKQVKLEVSINKLMQLRASLLPSQLLAGQPCDLVRVTKTYIDAYDPRHFLVTQQKTYWFARADGRLMRLQERRLDGGREAHSADFQVTQQRFNPPFAPDTFKFTPPKGAKLEKD